MSNLGAAASSGNWSEPPSTSNGDAQGDEKVSKLRAQVEDVKSVMVENVEKVLARGERLDELVDNAARLEESSASFRNTARQVRTHMCMRNAKWTICIVVAVVLILTAIILLVLYQVHVI